MSISCVGLVYVLFLFNLPYFDYYE